MATVTECDEQSMHPKYSHANACWKWLPNVCRLEQTAADQPLLRRTGCCASVQNRIHLYSPQLIHNDQLRNYHEHVSMHRLRFYLR